MLEKSKRKRGEDTGSFSWLRSLFEPQRFDFESPLNVEECAVVLQAMHDFHRAMGIFVLGKTRVDLRRLGTGGYQFTIRRKSGRSYALESKGTLRSEPGAKTAVMGETRIPVLLPMLMIFAITGMAFAVIGLGINDPIARWFFPLVWVFVIVYNTLYWAAKRDQLTRDIKDSLMAADEVPSFF